MSKTVMIVEDYADTREVMKVFVECYGYDVIVAADGYEAIEKSREFHPQLIFMDLALPRIDGATATKLIRESEGYKDVWIIALTGFSNTSFEKAIDAGFDDVLIKPLEFENLEPLLHRYLS